YNEARNPGSREARIVDDITRANGEGPNTKANLSRVIAKKKEMLRLVDERETSREDRKRFVKENQMFELNRQGFYRNLQDKTADSEAPAEEVRRYWQQLWTEKEDDCAQQDRLLETITPICAHEEMSIDKEAFMQAITKTGDWKAPGRTRVYGFFVKRITALHEEIFRHAETIIRGQVEAPVWYSRGTTVMIPKDEKKLADPTALRPITCMPVLYKIVNKYVAATVKNMVESKKKKKNEGREPHNLPRRNHCHQAGA
ncbi:MAG: uncharacterized protein A8A55_2914, partial [Amphiamblys sp. WSBS2006]